MHAATTKLYSVSLTSWFAEVVPFPEAGVSATAKKIQLRFAGYGLRPQEIVQRDGDRLFDYELSFSIFNRNGSIRLTSEGCYASFQNARDDKDASIISDCFLGITEVLSDKRIREHRLEAFVHAALPSIAERDKFLASLGPNDRMLPIGGCVLYVPPAGAFGEVRFLVDRSLLFPDAVFLHWASQSSQPLSHELFAEATAGFGRLSSELGLDFRKA
jgi:hypothetical protein